MNNKMYKKHSLPAGYTPVQKDVDGNQETDGW